jgi:hypothetical protein
MNQKMFAAYVLFALSITGMSAGQAHANGAAPQGTQISCEVSYMLEGGKSWMAGPSASAPLSGAGVGSLTFGSSGSERSYIAYFDGKQMTLNLDLGGDAVSTQVNVPLALGQSVTMIGHQAYGTTETGKSFVALKLECGIK